jgi:hypothetical protein
VTSFVLSNEKWPTWNAHIACHVIEYGRVGVETHCLATVSLGIKLSPPSYDANMCL